MLLSASMSAYMSECLPTWWSPACLYEYVCLPTDTSSFLPPYNVGPAASPLVSLHAFKYVLYISLPTLTSAWLSDICLPLRLHGILRNGVPACLRICLYVCLLSCTAFKFIDISRNKKMNFLKILKLPSKIETNEDHFFHRIMKQN
jgi:hypothetical protein